MRVLLGQTKRGYEIGKGTGWLYVWQACIDCGIERWVQITRGKPISYKCRSCGRRGNKNAWNNGVSYTGGYQALWLKPDSFFFPMVSVQKPSGGYVLRHRLVMAESLGRCLHSWEIVHHINHDRTDNRIGNLQLVSDLGHKQLELLERKVSELEKEIKTLRWRVKELESARVIVGV